MFENPSSGGLEVDDGKYVVKVKTLESVPPNEQFPNAGPGIKWIFNLADAQTGEVILDDRGFNADFWQFSSAKMTPNAKARKWATALLNREIANSETGKEIASQLPGLKALALIGKNEKGRTAILSMSPIVPKTNGQAPAAKAPPATVPASSPEAPPDEVLDTSDVDAAPAEVF